MPELDLVASWWVGSNGAKDPINFVRTSKAMSSLFLVIVRDLVKVSQESPCDIFPKLTVMLRGLLVTIHYHNLYLEPLGIRQLFGLLFSMTLNIHLLL